MNSLCWKEWRENQRSLLLFMVWMMLAAIYCIGYELGYRLHAPVGHFSSLAQIYATCAAIILAMRVSQGEHISGTHSFTSALPLLPRRMASVRLGGAVATLTIPILSAAAMLAVALVIGIVQQAEPRLPDYVRLPERGIASVPTFLKQLASVTAIATLSGIELLLILSVCGIRLRNQAQVGFLGAVLAVGDEVASKAFWFQNSNRILQMLYGAVFPQSLVIHWGYSQIGHGRYTDHELARYHWWALALAIPFLSLIAFLYIVNCGQLRKSVAVRTQGRFLFGVPAIWSRLQLPLPNRCVAMIWLELRQSLPLIIYGLLLATLIASSSLFLERKIETSVSDIIRNNLPHTVAFVGVVWAAVVGSGLYSAELRPGLGDFWRSRPITPSGWFWCKFLVGLFAVLSVLDGTAILINWNVSRNFAHGINWSYTACFPIMHAAIYSLAVLGTCWFRKPVIGGFLAILGYFVLCIPIQVFPATTHLDPIMIYNNLRDLEEKGQVDISQFGYPLVYGVHVIAVFVLAFFSARVARPLESAFVKT